MKYLFVTIILVASINFIGQTNSRKKLKLIINKHVQRVYFKFNVTSKAELDQCLNNFYDNIVGTTVNAYVQKPLF
jgi:hypothetical protein